MMFGWGVVTGAEHETSRSPSLQGLVCERMTVRLGRDRVYVGPAFVGWFLEMRL